MNRITLAIVRRLPHARIVDLRRLTAFLGLPLSFDRGALVRAITQELLK